MNDYLLLVTNYQHSLVVFLYPKKGGVDNMSNEELVQLIKQGTDPAGNMEQLNIQNKGMIFAVVKKYHYACQADYNSRERYSA